MIKPKALRKGDKVAIVSLSKGILGEAFCKHQVDLGLKRLKQFGLEPVIMPNALKGVEYLANNPQARAEDLKTAYYNPEIKGIICAIGGLDSYRLTPYLLDDVAFCDYVKNNPKVFTGFSDTTQSHLFFYKLGVSSTYGHNLLCDIAELDSQLLPYTEKAIQQFFENNLTEMYLSPIWYEERTDFSAKSLNTPRVSHNEKYGYEVLQGTGSVKGKLLGGCVESLYELLTGKRFSDQKEINQKYQLFPPLAEWEGKILFLETSEEKPTSQKFAEYLNEFKQFGLFDKINGIIFGKPQDEAFYHEYKQVLTEIIANPALPILYNLNFGHSYPRGIIPYGIEVELDLTHKRLQFLESLFK